MLEKNKIRKISNKKCHYFFFIKNNLSAKLLPNNQDIFVSQDTWTNYESMLRILKHFKLNYHLNLIGKRD